MLQHDSNVVPLQHHGAQLTPVASSFCRIGRNLKAKIKCLWMVSIFAKGKSNGRKSGYFEVERAVHSLGLIRILRLCTRKILPLCFSQVEFHCLQSMSLFVQYFSSQQKCAVLSCE